MKGNGLFATADIGQRQIIMECTGEIVDEVAVENRYAIDLDRVGLMLDQSTQGNESRFVNHSCSPNAEIQQWIVDEEVRAMLVSLKRIRNAEEITIKYDLTVFNGFPREVILTLIVYVFFKVFQILYLILYLNLHVVIQRCRCGARNCKRYIGKRAYECDLCDQVMDTPTKMERHRMSHRARRPHRCPTCNK